MTRRVQVVKVAVAPTLHTIPWPPVFTSLLVALGIGRLGPDDVSATSAGLVEVFRYGALVLALCLGFVLDDEAAPTIGAVPTTLATRRALRLLLALPVVAATWAIMLANAGTTRLPARALSLELAALVAVAIALAACATRDPAQQRGGLVAAPTLLALFVAAGQLPTRWALTPPPFTDQWAGAHQRWAGILAVAVVVGARASRDRGWPTPASSHPSTITRMGPPR